MFFTWRKKKIRTKKKKRRTSITAHYTKHKPRAEVYIRARVRELNLSYGFTYRRISVRNQKSRWGSCSTKKNLNFSYRLLFLPPDLADYIIVHELCHLAEFNHSPRFWALVAKTMPDFRARRTLLRKISSARPFRYTKRITPLF